MLSGASGRRGSSCLCGFVDSFIRPGQMGLLVVGCDWPRCGGWLWVEVEFLDDVRVLVPLSSCSLTLF